MKFKITLLILSTIFLHAQPINDESFILYQQMAPEVIDIINNQTKEIISCFERKKSLQNMNKCVSVSGEPIETMIIKLIPKQTSKLCSRDSSGNLSFIWSDENYKTIISELNKTIDENEKNKQCIIKSKTVEEYVQCLNSIK